MTPSTVVVLAATEERRGANGRCEAAGSPPAQFLASSVRGSGGGRSLRVRGGSAARRIPVVSTRGFEGDPLATLLDVGSRVVGPAR